MRGWGCHSEPMADVVIKSREHLEAWFVYANRAYAKVIALRSALRVLPLIAYTGLNNNVQYKNLTLTLMRAQAIAFLSILPKLDTINRYSINEAASKAADSARDYAYLAPGGSPSAFAVARTIFSTALAIEAGYASHASYGKISLDAITVAVRALTTEGLDDDRTADDIWLAIQADVNNLAEWKAPERLISERVWPDEPQWFADQNAKLEDDLEALGDDFSIWSEWYQRRVDGKTNAFARFDSDADENFYHFLVEQDDYWWKREPALVNGEIKVLVDSLRKTRETQPDPQTANAPNFGYGPTGRIGVDALAGNKELSRDAGAQSRFSKLHQRLRNLVAALKGNNNAGVLAEIADDILDALGSAIEETDPYSAVLDIESLRSALDIQQAYGENDDYRPLEGEQLRLAKNTIAAANLWVGSEEFLERIDATLPGPDHKRPLPESDDAIALADALKSDDLTEPSADKIIRKSAENIPETTDGEDRKTGLMVRGGLNLLRWSINAIVEHEGKVLAYAAGGATAGIFTSGFLATGGVALSAASFAFLLAKNIQKNEDIWRKWAQTARVTESNFDALMEKIRNLPLN